MKRTFLAAGALAALLGCGREAAVDGSAVLANVNGARVTQADLEAAVRALASDPQQADQILHDPAAAAERAKLVHQLAFHLAMDQIAAKQGLDKDPLVRFQMADSRAMAFANVLVSRAAGNAAPTDDQLHAFYDAQMAARKAAGQDKGIAPFDAFLANPQLKGQLAEAWRQDTFNKAQAAFQQDLKAQVPVTYADGLQSAEF